MFRQTVLGGLTLACAGSVCAWILNAALAPPDRMTPAVPLQPQLKQKVVNVKPIPARVVLEQYASLFDSTSSLGAPPTQFVVPMTFESRWAEVAPEQQQVTARVAVATTKEVEPPPNVVQEVADAVPLPTPRPSIRSADDAGPSRQDAERANKVAALTPPQQEEKPLSIFEKLFGRFRPQRQTLAYASPDGGLSADAIGGKYDRYTAVYDISAHTVYMPDGRRLEAHSGLGDMLDDPRYVNRRMRGATPPATYSLKLRESLFHGVEALRLTPIDSNVFGRSGLLAHTYMLGPNGDSNGCVSFRDYNAFLQAFKKQEIKKLVVVAKL